MLAGKCALITGSTAGLGYAIAGRLAASGCNIVLNGIAPADEGLAAQETLARDHGPDRRRHLFPVLARTR